jgi:sigma-E factor negative regulatory protein RseC
MIEQQGRVVATAGARVRVRLGGTSGCSACDAGHGCGAGVFGRLLRRRPVELEFDNPIGAEPGQAVMVGLPESLFLAMTLRLYLLPLLAGLAGAAAGHWLGLWAKLEGGALDLATAVSGIVLALIALRRARNRRMEFSPDRVVKLLRIVNPSNR